MYKLFFGLFFFMVVFLWNLPVVHGSKINHFICFCQSNETYFSSTVVQQVNLIKYKVVLKVHFAQCFSSTAKMAEIDSENCLIVH